MVSKSLYPINKKKDEEELLENAEKSQSADDYTDVANHYMDEYLNKPDFSYNYDADALYQNYKRQYQQQAEQAKRDAVAQASGLTGGYGSTYAQNLGKQAQENAMEGLDNVIPSLYDAAKSRYDADTDALKQKADYYQSVADSISESDAVRTRGKIAWENILTNGGFSDEKTKTAIGYTEKIASLVNSNASADELGDSIDKYGDMLKSAGLDKDAVELWKDEIIRRIENGEPLIK